MILFEWILVLLFAAVVLTAAAERLRVPYPSLLAIAGAGIAFLPFAPDIRIEPDLALALFVAPALLDAAFDTSPQELRRNVIPVVSLAVFAVPEEIEMDVRNPHFRTRRSLLIAGSTLALAPRFAAAPGCSLPDRREPAPSRRPPARSAASPG